MSIIPITPTWLEGNGYRPHIRLSKVYVKRIDRIEILASLHKGGEAWEISVRWIDFEGDNIMEYTKVTQEVIRYAEGLEKLHKQFGA